MRAATCSTLVFCLSLLYAGALFGGVEPAVSAYLDGSKFVPFSPNATFTNHLSGYTAPGTPYIFQQQQQVRKIENRLELYLDPENLTFIDFPYSLEVTVEITQYEHGASAPKLETVTLKINYDPAEHSKWIEKANYHFVNCGRVEYEVLSATLSSGADPQKVAKVVALRSDIVIERYFPFNFTTPPTFAATPHTHDATKNELTIQWLPLPGAEYYDLEWAYVDDYDKSPTGSPISIPPGNLVFNKHFNLDRNSTRVRVTTTQYTFPLVFERGWILYRVRGIGMDYEPTTDIVYPIAGTWSTTTNQAPTVATWSHKFQITTAFEQDKLNWQVVASYAEEGKSKHVITFMDGTYRNRQTITGLSTEREAMVAEQIYDHQGRPAIQVLPVPTNDPRLKYYKHFNLSSPGGQPYNREHFDQTKINIANGACDISADPMHTSSGASQYYSPQNPIKTGRHAYIPDASGYPFIQTEYTPDNTGRICRQSGVGPDHRLGSNHETVYFYGTPVQEELSMLFGVEVGHADHYKKNVVQDPNGQLSVSFLDLKGKVIATALAGNPPKNLDSLHSYDPYQMDIDLMVFNKVDSLANELVASRSFTVTTRSDYTFNYTLSRPAFEAALCQGVKLCNDCVYDLEITVIDNYSCNYVAHQEIKQINPLQFDADGEISVNDGCPKNPLSHASTFTIKDLAVGSYTVTKRLKVNQAATDAYVNHYLARFEKDCKSVYDSILQSFLSQVDSLACELDDDEGPLNRCEVARSGMLTDMSPGGQYGLVDWTTYSANDPLSVFNTSNILPQSWATGAHWRNPATPYLNEDGSTAQIRNPNGVLVLPGDASITLQEFLQNWEDSWAESLLPYHPEYCYLEWCESDMASFDFDAELALVDKYSDAVSKGYLSAGGNVQATIVGKDPYFNAGGGGANTNDLNWINKSISDYYPPNALPNTQTYSLLEVAVWTALISQANPNLTQANPHPSIVPPFSQVTSWLSNPATNPQIADSVWIQFRAMYLSKKEELQYGKRTHYAMNVCAKNGGYNECIGADPFHWQKNGFASGAFGGKFHNSRQTCSWPSFLYYKDKDIRFPSVYNLLVNFDPYGPPADVVQSAADWAGGMIGANCDTCICNKAFTQFVNWVIDTKPYFPGGQFIPLPSAPFVSDFQQLIKNCNGVIVTTINTQLMNNSDVRITMYSNANAYGGEIFLKAPAGNINYWELADSISCIKYLGVEEIFDLAGGTLFTVSNQTYPVKILIRPNCVLEKCADPGLSCPPTEQAKYLSQVFNSLISQQQLDKTLQLDNKYISPGFAAYFHPVANIQSNINWSGQFSNAALDATLSSSQVNCRFTLTFPGGTALNALGHVISFTPDQTQIDPATGYTYHAVMKVALLNGGTVTVKVKSACFPFSYCLKCPPGEGGTRPRSALVPEPKAGAERPGKNTRNPDAQPAPAIPGDLNAVAGHDPDKPCHPCDPTDFTLDYDVMATDTSGVMVHQKPPADLCDPCNWPRDTLPTIPIPNPCLEEQIIAAYANAAYAYQQLLDSLAREIRNGYVRHCMAAAETFTAKYTDDLHHFTLYYYDQAGNLLKTVPPDGVKPLNTTATKAAIAYMRAKTGAPVNPAHEMASDYTFNSLNQLRKQTIPDHDGESEFFYDYLSRIVVSQNPEQGKDINSQRYSYTLYDSLNRPYETGELLNVPAAAAMTDALAKNEPQLLAWIAAYPRREVTRTRYDKPLPGIAAQFFNGDERNYRDRIASATYSELDGSPVKHSTYYRYDIHGNVAHLVQDVYGLTPKKMEYDYDLISGNVKQVWYQKGEVDQYLHRYQYDADNRIIAVRTSRDGKVWDLDADYFYYRHGPLARTELGEHKVQGLDYAYTLHGWIKGVNSAALSEVVDIGRDGRRHNPNSPLKFGKLTAKDAFGYTLRYYTGDYKAIAPAPLGWEPAYAGTAFHRPQRDLFNGNIQSMITAIGNPAGANTNFKPLGYAYTYDQLNRITAMQAYDGLNQTANHWNGAFPISDYQTAYSYDGNGNLQTLTRKGTTSGGAPLDMDDFKYRYYPGRNRLEYVDDAVPAGNYPEDIDDQLPGCYQYDAVGNLILDNSENIDIHWNVAGKVKYIQKTAAAERIDFSYDATGKRVIKKVANTATKKTDYTYYVLDATGNVMATYTYTDANLPMARIDHRLQSLYLYGSSRLGEERIDTTLSALKNIQNRQNDTWYSYRSRGAKYFELGNHLGNVLATVSDRKLPYDLGGDKLVNGYEADMWTAQDYYPFGSGMPKRGYAEGGYRYGFQGQSKEDIIRENLIYYKYRIHDSRIGRFISVDPISKSFPFNSPYAFSENRVNDAIEFEGLESKIIIKSKWYANKIEKSVNSGDLIEAYRLTYRAIQDNVVDFVKDNDSKGIIIMYDHITITNNKEINMMEINDFYNIYQQKIKLQNSILSLKKAIDIAKKVRKTFEAEIQKTEAEEERKKEMEAEFMQNISDGDNDLINSGGSSGRGWIDAASVVVKTGFDSINSKLNRLKKQKGILDKKINDSEALLKNLEKKYYDENDPP